MLLQGCLLRGCLRRAEPGRLGRCIFKVFGFGGPPCKQTENRNNLKPVWGRWFLKSSDFRPAGQADLKIGRLLKSTAPQQFVNVSIFGMVPGRAPTPEYFENTTARQPGQGSAEGREIAAINACIRNSRNVRARRKLPLLMLPPTRLPLSKLPPTKLPPSRLPPSRLPPSRMRFSRMPPPSCTRAAWLL